MENLIQKLSILGGKIEKTKLMEVMARQEEKKETIFFIPITGKGIC